jgi:hypothetical protein
MNSFMVMADYIHYYVVTVYVMESMVLLGITVFKRQLRKGPGGSPEMEFRFRILMYTLDMVSRRSFDC